VASNAALVIPNAKLYHFGILTSTVHMAWMRTVGGRLGDGYRYSKEIVYNNFPWPDASEKQQATITNLAQAILDTRDLFPSCSLADLYDPLTMPPQLLTTHRELDRAVLKLYGLPGKDIDDARIVAVLFERYHKLVESEQAAR
jgi:hypothetical protein